jgi:hypothetical protein
MWCKCRVLVCVQSVFIFVIYETLCENCKLVLMARDGVRGAFCYLIITGEACSGGGHRIRWQFTEHCVCLSVCSEGASASSYYCVSLGYRLSLGSARFFSVMLNRLGRLILHPSQFYFTSFSFQFHILHSYFKSFPVQFRILPSSISHPCKFSLTSIPIQFHILHNSFSHLPQFNFSSFHFHILTNSVSHTPQFNFTSSTIQFLTLPSSFSHPYQFNVTFSTIQFHIFHNSISHPSSSFSHPYQFNFASFSSSICSLPLIVWV